MGRMTRWNAGSVVLALTALLGGCTGVIPGEEPRPPSVVADAGGFEVRRGRPGLVIGVPDAGSDLGVSRDLARLTGFGLVAVTDGRRAGSEMRGAVERASLPARVHGDAYGRRVVEAAQGAILLYVEVQGQDRAARAMGLDIGTVGLSSEDAWRLKTLFELIRDSRLGGADGAPPLAITVAKWDAFRAPGVAPARSPSGPERALYIGLPRSARTTYRETYTGILADFLLQSVTVLVPRQR